MSFGRTQQLRELMDIIQEISKEIMWVNEREEEELMFDWGDKNIEQYIPKKQESYSVSQAQGRRETGNERDSFDAAEFHFLISYFTSFILDNKHSWQSHEPKWC